MSTANLFPSVHSHPLSRNLTKSRVAPSADQAVGTLVWWTMFLSSFVAMLTSGYLAWSSLTSSPVAGCSGDSLFDCNHVLHSRWSSVLSVPVSIPAVLTHVAILGLLLSRPQKGATQTLRWNAIGLASLTAGGAAVWFVGLQIFALGQLCPYCLVAHAAGLVLAGVYLWSLPISKRALRWVASGAVASVAVLAALQLGTEAPPTYEVIEHSQGPAGAAPATNMEYDAETEFFAPPASAAPQASLFPPAASKWAADVTHLLTAVANPTILLSGQVSDAGTSQPQRNTASVLGGVKLATTEWPLIGNPDAEMVFVELFDYTCPHCQQTHRSLSEAKKQFGDRLAVITLPVPLDGKCNPTIRSTHASHGEACEIAKLAIAVWAVDQGKFAQFHDYLFESKPNFATAKAKAMTIVNGEELEKTLSGPVPSDYIKRHVALYQKAGAGKIPKLLFPKTSTVGAVGSPQAMVRLIQQNL
ncbi:Vitamin K epoxide reductase family protein [Stieleria maiorica]|uniref:Vitamin K epoxide reductase family protein n=1 Tax=Stieleria maiorica TaxID=2795974 RepID=A0A5B9MAM0_9BACT|nr:vitamin K epoxide reductase family protein [Stieleria maiorica]QEF98272.1 Vitamin K epoxide reductase family protein [Stieleria maiorica]